MKPRMDLAYTDDIKALHIERESVVSACSALSVPLQQCFMVPLLCAVAMETVSGMQVLLETLVPPMIE